MQNINLEKLRLETKRKHEAEAKREMDVAEKFDIGAVIFCALLGFGTWFWLLTLGD